MSVPNNNFKNVATYQKAELAVMRNEYGTIEYSNKEFKDFNQREANLGDTVTFDLTPRSYTANGLVVTNFMPSQQRVQTLVCSQAANTNTAFSDQQWIFNVENYMDRFDESRVLELGTEVETDINKNFVSGVTVLDPQSPNFGQLTSPESGPYRFYGDGVTPINSFNQLAKAMAFFRTYGAAKKNPVGILQDIIVPEIIGTGLNQFVPDRNEKIALSWRLGEFSSTKWMQSNLLPTHISGSVGDAGAPNNILTLVNVNDPTGQNITQLTCSGATPNVTNALVNGDLMQIIPGNYARMNYLTFIGHKPSAAPVQIRVVTNSPVRADNSGNVTFNIFPALVSVPGNNQNLNNPLQPGMQFQVVPSHVGGCIMSGDPLYLAMPKLRVPRPWDGVSTMDEESGVSIRHYWGAQAMGQNTEGYIWDVIWGSTLVAENSMRLIIPLNNF